MKKRRIISVFVALIVAICGIQLQVNNNECSINIVASAASHGSFGNITYNLDDEGNLTISGSGRMYSSSSPFKNKSTIKKVVVEEGITSIGSYMFNGCSVESITLPSSLTMIERSAFYNCKKLQNINIPQNVNSIGYDYSDGSTPVIISDDTNGDAFLGCEKLECITVDSNNQKYCDLGGVLFNKEMTSLLKYPEGKASASYQIPEGISSFSEKAFRSCINLVEVLIPQSMTSIPYEAFLDCKNLKSVVLNDNVTKIGRWAFKNCNNLQSIHLPATVSDVYKNSFEGCTNLYEITVDKDNEQFTSVDGVVYTKNLQEIIIYPTGKRNTTFVVPEGVKSIGNAFSGSEYLSQIVVSNNVSDYNFSINNCPNLKKVEIGDGIEEISWGAFYNCPCLESIKIGKSFKRFLYTGHNDNFEGADSLKEVIIDPDNPQYESDNGIMYTKGKECIVLYPKAKIDSTFDMPDTVTKIAYKAFWNCKNLKSISVPSALKQIEPYAMYDCTNLETMSLPEGLAMIGAAAFKNCVSLNNFVVPESVYSIGDDDSLHENLSWRYMWDRDKDAFSTTINVYNNSDALAYAIRHEIPHNIIGDATFKPYNLSAAQIDNSVNLLWTIVYGVKGYKVYRSENETIPNIPIADNVMDANYTDTSVKSGKTYYYYVSSIKQDDSNSVLSDYVKIQITGDTPLPSSNSISGTIPNFSKLNGTATIKLINSKGIEIGSVQSTDGSYSFNSNIIAGEKYKLRVTMPKCAPREYDVTGKSTPVTQDAKILQYGDPDGNGIIEARDATQILYYEVGKTCVMRDKNGIVDQYLVSVAHVLPTGELSAKDATQILRQEVGLHPNVFDTLS